MTGSFGFGASGASPPLVQPLTPHFTRYACPRCASSPLTVAHNVFAMQAGVRFQANTCHCGPAGLVAWLPVSTHQLQPTPLVDRARDVFLRAAQRGPVDVVDPAELTLRDLAQGGGAA